MPACKDCEIALSDDNWYPSIKAIGRRICYNCNLSRGHYGYCPHERENANAVA